MELTADVLRLKSSAASEEGGSRCGERDWDELDRRRAWEVGVGRWETPFYGGRESVSSCPCLLGLREERG